MIVMNKEQKAQRQFIGIEIDDEYYEIAKKRIGSDKEWKKQ